MKKSLIAVLVIALVCLSAVSFAKTFSDVTNHWAKSSIDRWSNEGVINGYSDGTYKPESNITRAEFSVFICKIFEPTKKADISKYKDVDKDAWYYDYMSKAVAMGVIEPTSSSRMSPDALVSRQEMVVTINSVIKFAAKDGKKAIKEFSDYAYIGEYAEDDVEAFAERKFVIGYPDGEFKPSRPITRAEAATIFDRLIFDIVDEKGDFDAEGTDRVIIVKAKNVNIKNGSKATIVFLNDDIKDSTKGLTKDQKNDSVVINPSEKSSSKSTGRGGSSSSSSTTKTDVEITISKATDGTLAYKFTKSSSLAFGKNVKFVYPGGSKTVNGISADNIIDNCAAVAKKLDPAAVMATFDSELNTDGGILSSTEVNDWGFATIDELDLQGKNITGCADAYRNETTQKVTAVYNQLNANGVSYSDIVDAAIKVLKDNGKTGNDVLSLINEKAS